MHADAHIAAEPARLRVTGLRYLNVGPISFDVAPGECVGLSGPSGAGKSLLLRALADLDPHEGQIWLDGVPCQAWSPCEWRRQVGLLPAESGWWAPRVGEHLSGVSERSLQVLGFDAAVRDWQVERTSTGERQRLALLRLLANRPKVLLLDEPTANLDPRAAQAVERLLLSYLRDEAAALLWVSHDAAQLERVASRRGVLSDGRLRLEGGT